MDYIPIIISSALFLGSVGAPLCAQAPPTITVELKQVKASVSPTLYGLMTEEINYSYDGGMYAELIRNRTFRSDWTGVLNWFVVEKGAASAKLSMDNGTGPSSALSTSAKLEVTKADASNLAGLLNEGYWGIAVRPNTRYTGSFYAKTDYMSGLPVRIALVADQSGQVLASTNVTITGAAWKPYEFEMQSGRAAPGSENHFEMTVDRPATVWLQLVSLFPPTYHGPRKRQSPRPDGKAGRNASQFSALPRRQLSRRQSHRNTFRLEENDRPASGSSDASDHLELPLERWHGIAGVSAMVRGPAHAAGLAESMPVIRWVDR